MLTDTEKEHYNVNTTVNGAVVICVGMYRVLGQISGRYNPIHDVAKTQLPSDLLSPLSLRGELCSNLTETVDLLMVGDVGTGYSE